MRKSSDRSFAGAGLLRGLRVAAALGALAFCQAAHAAENGLSNFPYGAQTTYAAYLPAPGTTSFFGYALYVTANAVKDDDGHKIPGVKLDGFALAPRIVHTWSTQWAGFDLSSGAVVQGIALKVQTPGATQRNTGPTLIAIEPLHLTRSFGNLRILAGPLFYFPIGPYEVGASDNTTQNYRSYVYEVSSTWTPTPNIDFSLNAAIEHKDENKKTDYRSGNQASITYGLGYKPFADKRWDLGFSGFYTEQLNDDKIDGDKVSGSRTRKFGIGPKLVYWISPAAAIVTQYHHEMDAHNASEGDLFWLECAFPI